MPAHVHCPICFIHYPLGVIQVFPCGHGYCNTCTDTLLPNIRSRKPCPQCRATIRRDERITLHVDITDSKTAGINDVVEKIGQMDAETGAIGVKKAGERIAKAAETMDRNDDMDMAATLIQSIEDFKQRIIPLFTRVESQAQEIDNLRKAAQLTQQERDEIDTQKAKAASYKSEIGRLRNHLRETEKNTEQALELAEQAKEEVIQLREKNATYQRMTSDLDNQKKRLEDLLETHVTTARAQKTKYRALKHQYLELKNELAATKEQHKSDLYNVSQFSEYDLGEFSEHVPESPSRHLQPQETNIPDYDFEGMPPPGFASDWQLGHTRRTLVKKGAESKKFPISLDRKGHPTTAVQVGPKNTLRVRI